MILALDNYFLDRSRMMELKDGKPLNEVRVLWNSITTNQGKLWSDKTIKLDPTEIDPRLQGRRRDQAEPGQFRKAGQGVFPRDRAQVRLTGRSR
jgi:hypothetical protein